MQLMVPQETVIVVRGGKRVKPQINKAFPFTDAEVQYLNKHRPEAIRKARNEMGDQTEEEILADQPTDDEVEQRNEQATEEANEAAIQKAGEKALAANGAGKAVKATRAKAAKAAAEKVDDL